jgi:hypothetical protein
MRLFPNSSVERRDLYRPNLVFVEALTGIGHGLSLGGTYNCYAAIETQRGRQRGADNDFTACQAQHEQLLFLQIGLGRIG